MLRILLICFLVSISINAKSSLEKIPIQAVFVEVEQGEVSLYVEAYLPDTCYREPRAEFYKRKGVMFLDIVSNVVGQVCAEVVRFVDLSIPLGKFAPGSYSLVFQKYSRWAEEIYFEVD